MNSSEREAFGARVREERKARRMTQPELAARVGVSVGTISATERGISLPQPGNLVKLQQELGISMNGDSAPIAEEAETTWGAWFEALPKDARSTLYMIGLYLERLGPDERDARIREIVSAIVDQRL